MPEMSCIRCGELFEYDSNDGRPFVYHRCDDGVLMAYKNPNNIPKKRSFSNTDFSFKKKNKTVWQEF